MNFLTCRYYKRVYETGSISKAAAELGITQQSLSQVIAKTEEEYGTTLFERTRPLSPTESGKLLYSSVCVILSELEKLEERLGAEKERIHIGYELDSSSVLISNALFRFRQEHPGISITAEKLREGAVYDIILVLGGSYQGMEEYSSFDDTTTVIAGKRLLSSCWKEKEAEKRAALERDGDLAIMEEIPFLKLSEKIAKSSTDYLDSLFLECGIRIQWNQVTGPFTLMHNLCTLGEGAAIMPGRSASCIWRENKEVDLFEIRRPQISWHFRLMTRSTLKLTGRIRRLLSLLAE